MNFNLKKGDFCILSKKFANVEPNSFCVVEEVQKDTVYVFFQGPQKHLSVPKLYLKYFDYKNTGEKSKNPHVKVCDRCFMLKSIENFAINQTDAKGRKTRRPSCIDCRLIIDGISLNNEERKKLKEKSPIGKISKCPICEKETIAGITKWVMDHDHKTGLGRDWLCDSCNTGLGRFKDNITTLENAIRYLKKHAEFGR